jgi:hypothetical protein
MISGSKFDWTDDMRHRKVLQPEISTKGSSMDLTTDPRQPVSGTVGWLESWRTPAVGLAVDDGASLTGAGRRPYSYWAECECPDDCPRDHENE